jgi:hypothetical protein
MAALVVFTKVTLDHDLDADHFEGILGVVSLTSPGVLPSDLNSQVRLLRYTKTPVGKSVVAGPGVANVVAVGSTVVPIGAAVRVTGIAVVRAVAVG